MNYLLFIIYLLLFCWLLTKSKFIQLSNLGNRVIIILFLFRILAGMANGWINLYYYPVSDSALFHLEGIKEFHLMFSNPKEYLLNIFDHKSTTSYAALFDTTDSFWNNLRSNIIIKLLSIFDIFSNRNYFINTLFYNFFVFFGSVSFYRIFIQIFSNRKNTIIITTFLLPSLVYFSSGIHRDGLIFLGIAILCYNMFNILYKEGHILRRILFTLSGFLLIFLLRNFVFIALLPALAAWIIAEKRPKFILITFSAVYICFTILFFSLKFIHQKLDLPRQVSGRQNEFIEIGKQGASSININPLFPEFRSFLNNAPQALNHTLMRPYLSENFTSFYIPLALEILLYEILLLAYFLFPLKSILSNSGFIYFGIFFSISMYLLIGYTIPIMGAIVRYRSIYLPFLITPMACLIDRKKIYSALNINK